MPVRKYRDVTEMPDALWFDKGSPELLRALRETWEMVQRTLRPRFPPGVHKHRSIEEAQQLSDAWDRANFEAYQRRQRSASGAVESSREGDDPDES
ncbi:MAG: hypothetical protein DWQ36_08965 [Acidobacteria bacterium]|nr:MAG: hypothetical protein DWQ30_22210 [Acidobacteriota bacterium]REK08492.1 MAG: hypothetical protein DWQ36_08965 [Acidobacteriota bacterium]